MTPRDKLLALASEVKGLEANEPAAFRRAFKLLFPEISAGCWDAIDAWDRMQSSFNAMLDCGAYESAAMMLLPEGIEGLRLSFKVGHFYLGNGTWEARAAVWDGLGSVSSLDTASIAATPALALLAAILRALLALADMEGQTDETP